MKQKHGGFTLPGEAGYEALTLELAKKWGADVIRDSDGTELSPELVEAGYGIYSTICIIRGHNPWLVSHPETQQQSFLITEPVVAIGDALEIDLLAGFFDQQFQVNDGPEALHYWQVYDRTTGEPLTAEAWQYRDGRVRVERPVPWHSYTVSFLAWRLWEEISMYNYTTNDWDGEHLRQLDPVYPEAQAYLREWLERWCQGHPDTTVVRFTSMFYNFSWIWGADLEKNRDLFVDWASYTFTVSPLMLDNFQKAYGYALTAEDFVNGGKYRTTHMPPDDRLRAWMDFVSRFVADFGRELVDIVHRHGKKAYVFYDDSWVGVEPYGPYFARFGFDGIIKAVFSGFESRLCAGVEGAAAHELRLHPYLFPVGLGGAPTFAPGGDPTRDALAYWVAIRRAMLRAPIQRIGLGGYLHLVEGYPDFVDCVANIAAEFRAIRDLHASGAPQAARGVVGVLSAWGDLRSWTCCGHYHENPNNDLINLIESLSGLPFDVRFLRFDEVEAGVPEGIDVLVNAGFAGSAWSGSAAWHSERLVASLTAWAHGGGVLLGAGAPSAVEGYNQFFRLAPVLGVDLDTGTRVNHGRRAFAVEADALVPAGAHIAPLPGLYLTDGEARVLLAGDGLPCLVQHPFGRGMGLYLASYRHTAANARLLLNLLLSHTGQADALWQSDDARVECCWFPGAGQLAVVNNSAEAVRTRISTPGQPLALELAPYACRFMALETR